MSAAVQTHGRTDDPHSRTGTVHGGDQCEARGIGYRSLRAGDHDAAVAVMCQTHLPGDEAGCRRRLARPTGHPSSSVTVPRSAPVIRLAAVLVKPTDEHVHETKRAMASI